MMDTAHSPTEVVSPFNWFLELNKIVLELITAMPMTVAADKKGNVMALCILINKADLKS